MNDEELYLQIVHNAEVNASVPFSKLYATYSGPLFRYIYRFAGNTASTEDILQDVFCELLAGKYQPHSSGTLKSWLYVVAKNKSLNYLKRAAHEVTHEHIPDIADTNTDLELQGIEKSTLKILAEKLQALPLELRQTWDLRRAGLDNNNIATKLNIPLGTVKSRFFRIVEFLKKEMSDENN